MRRLMIAWSLLLATACTVKENLGDTVTPTPLIASTRWALTLGSVYDDGARSVAFDPSGDVIAAGHFKGSVDFGNAVLQASKTSGWVSKRAGIDGAERWTIAIGAESSAQADLVDVAVTADGSILVLGNYSGDLHLGQQVLQGPVLAMGSDCFLAKYDGSGQLVWARSLGPATTAGCNALAVAADGRSAIVGSYQGTVEFPNGTFTARDHDMFLAAFDANGLLQWGITAQNPGGTIGVQGLYAGSVAMTVEDDIIIAGNVSYPITFEGSLLQPNARVSQFVARFTLDGHKLWAGVVGTSGEERETGPMTVDSTGGVVMTSTRRSSTFQGNGLPGIDALDPNGLALWNSQAMSGSATVNSVTVLNDGTVVTGGFTAGFPIDFGTGTLTGCMYLAAHDREGHLVDAISYVEPGRYCSASTPLKLATEPSGAIAFSGILDQPADFGTGTLRLGGGIDAMIVVIDTN